MTTTKDKKRPVRKMVPGGKGGFTPLTLSDESLSRLSHWAEVGGTWWREVADLEDAYFVLLRDYDRTGLAHNGRGDMPAGGPVTMTERMDALNAFYAARDAFTEAGGIWDGNYKSPENHG
jgi:hypothetical protein